MKYLITIVLALFISSNSYSVDSSEVESFKSIRDLCKKTEDSILLFKNFEQSLLRELLNKEISSDEYNKRSKGIKEPMQDHIKNYHYLDCREELGR